MNVFKNPNAPNSALYLEALMMDILYMAEVMSLDIEKELLILDLKEIVKEVHRLLSKIKINNSRLIGIDLRDIDTIVFEYV